MCEHDHNFFQLDWAFDLSDYQEVSSAANSSYAKSTVSDTVSTEMNQT